MIYSGDYTVPQIHGWTYYNKPPFFNWILVIFMKVFSSFDEWVVRLPGLLAHIITSLLIYFFTRSQINREVALTSALIYFTSSEILFYGAVISGQIDLFFTLLVFLQLAFLFKGLHQSKGLFLLLSYVFLSLGILTKGVPSIAFQVLSLLGWAVIHRNLRRWMILYHLLGVAIASTIVSVYFMIYHLQGGQSTIYLINLFHEAAQKSALETQSSQLIKNFIEFPTVFLKLALPWIILTLLMIEKKYRQQIWQVSWVRFCIIVIAANLLLYWLAGYITTRYLFPFVPFLAVILGSLFENASNANDKRLRYFDYTIQLLIIFAPLGLLWFVFSKNGFLMQNQVLKIALAVLVSAGCYYALKTRPAQRFLIAVFFILCLKQYSQWTYYPMRYADERENSLIAQIPLLFSHTSGQSIHLLGHPEEHQIDISLGKWSFVETTFEDAMPLSYQLPYYIERYQGSIMDFHTRLQRDRYYLVRKHELDHFSEPNQFEILYEFVDDWKNIPLALIKT
ncbi:MAG: glycosyltransferase family 39 protein [Saprospiraceae bacterium]|nr:glycosyltransferase family 39 protein [Saprospiraceae bacterium]